MGLLLEGGEGRGQGWVRVAGGHVCIGQSQFSGAGWGGGFSSSSCLPESHSRPRFRPLGLGAAVRN